MTRRFGCERLERLEVLFAVSHPLSCLRRETLTSRDYGVVDTFFTQAQVRAERPLPQSIFVTFYQAADPPGIWRQIMPVILRVGHVIGVVDGSS